MTNAAFASVILDVDSTLCGVEGVDWLAQRRDPALAAELAELTIAAMSGELPLEAIYARRLERIRPSDTDIAALAEVYRETVADGAGEAIRRMRIAGVAVHLVSGGLRQAILPVSEELGFEPSEVHAVPVIFDEQGQYTDFDRTSPLTTAAGKREVVAALGLAKPRLAVGDGMTDAAMRSVTEEFAAYTGFVRRDSVVGLAGRECRTFDDLLHLVLP